MVIVPITLYAETHWDSPFVFTVYVALHEKRLPFEERALDLAAGEHRRGDLPTRSLTGRVPILEHDQFLLAESLAIAEYLEERFPPPQHAAILPESIEERARARQVLSWLRTDFPALRRDRPTSSMFGARATAPMADEARADAERLIRITERLVAPGQAWLFRRFTIADADLAFMLHRLILNGDPVPAAIATYATAVWARPSVQAFAAHRR